MLACINSVILAAVEHQRYVCNMIVNVNARLYIWFQRAGCFVYVLWPTCYFINIFLLVYLSLSDLKIAYGAVKGLVLCFVDKDVLYMRCYSITTFGCCFYCIVVAMSVRC